MARFGTKLGKRFSARTQVFPGAHGPRIGFVTPGIKRFRRPKKTGTPTQINRMVKP